MIKNYIMVIPSYEPETLLIDLIQEFSQTFAHIIIVNDGSRPECSPIFQQVKTISGVVLIEHKENKGKGAALKTGFSYVLKHFPESIGIVMCDADGQHLPKDVLKVAQKAEEIPDSFVFGTRTFNRENTPFRSWLGNVVTEKLLKLFLRTSLTDTQTGLRVYPIKYLKQFINIPYDRYEYDTESILLISKNNWDLKTVPIETVYIDNNRSSHFNPVLDSLKIYWVILRFVIVAFLSFLIDIVIFTIMTSLSFSTAIALSTSKFISALFNFSANRKLTFQSQHNIFRSMVLYILLWCMNVWIGIYLIDQFVAITGYSKIPIKIGVDFILFMVNFLISKTIIFKSSAKV